MPAEQSKNAAATLCLGLSQSFLSVMRDNPQIYFGCRDCLSGMRADMAHSLQAQIDKTKQAQQEEMQR